ncbi:arsenate reductase (azurin) small subunit [Bosea vaviloviae]|uniref:arsenate reductase (azurin) small subunit n=1 Tax=Bosea vaviloviae TaxID=1526658 RepID=UPI000AC8813B|nr:arsenate reductase (azurin) small subunit [Bosea vaviloviae]
MRLDRPWSFNQRLLLTRPTLDWCRSALCVVLLKCVGASRWGINLTASHRRPKLDAKIDLWEVERAGRPLPAIDGVGLDGDIIGFATLCPHEGYPLAFNATDKTLNCPGHYSRFDCEAGGQQIWGQATQNLPQYALRVEANGDIVAEELDELLYGRLSNVL